MAYKHDECLNIPSGMQAYMGANLHLTQSIRTWRITILQVKIISTCEYAQPLGIACILTLRETEPADMTGIANLQESFNDFAHIVTLFNKKAVYELE